MDNAGVCNLTTINVRSFVLGPNKFDLNGFLKAIRMAVRMGSRITNTRLWHPRWDDTQRSDRLLGVSLTGQLDAFLALGYIDHSGAAALLNRIKNTVSNIFNFDWEKLETSPDIDSRIIKILRAAKKTAHTEMNKYHREMGIPPALLVTTVKPEGTISQIPSISSGVHRPYAPYYLRRIRISKFDPVAKALRELMVPCVPENNQGKDLDAPQCNTWIFSFPMKTEAKKRAIDESALAQLERYKMMMINYVDHNCSVTISVDSNEWEQVADWVYKNWDYVIGISFLPKWDPLAGDSPFPNLPYEPITQARYEHLIKEIHIEENVLLELIAKYEREGYEESDLGSDCTSGFCPIR